MNARCVINYDETIVKLSSEGHFVFERRSKDRSHSIAGVRTTLGTLLPFIRADGVVICSFWVVRGAEGSIAEVTIPADSSTKWPHYWVFTETGFINGDAASLSGTGTRESFAALAFKAEAEALSKAAIRTGFEHSGIWPWNPTLILSMANENCGHLFTDPDMREETIEATTAFINKFRNDSSQLTSKTRTKRVRVQKTRLFNPSEIIEQAEALEREIVEYGYVSPPPIISPPFGLSIPLPSLPSHVNLLISLQTICPSHIIASFSSDLRLLLA